MSQARPLLVVLEDAHDARLTRLADGVAVDREELASALLATALDQAETDGGELTLVLDGVRGAWERAELGRRQGLAGATKSLDEL
ncbi:MAG: hypothetical protein WD399_06785 [Thermoleophilaceae bacterium]